MAGGASAKTACGASTTGASGVSSGGAGTGLPLPPPSWFVPSPPVAVGSVDSPWGSSS